MEHPQTFLANECDRMIFELREEYNIKESYKKTEIYDSEINLLLINAFFRGIKAIKEEKERRELNEKIG